MLQHFLVDNYWQVITILLGSVTAFWDRLRRDLDALHWL